MRRLILLDFDGTLFDTRSFAQEMARIFMDYGETDFFATFPKNEFGTYSLREHLLIVPTNARRKAVKRQMRKLFLRCPEFLFDDTIGFLSRLRQDPRNTIIIVTRGEREYQYKRVYMAFAGFKPLLDKVVVVEDKTKARHIKDLISSYVGWPGSFKHVFFVDDTQRELRDAKAAVPSLRVILIDRYSSDPKISSGFFVRNLGDTIKIIHASG
ncbi:MAG: hypothetical protein HY506_01675 [Candidatus Yanofskybacteria bacterium]|nr:hypothetical protein [Candidatus Yanofskybacteria bacterium]